VTSPKTELRFSGDDVRIRRWNDEPVRTPRQGAEYVLYFCHAYRRARDNAALAYAIERANELSLPCLFYESIRPDYPHASDRHHTFAIECARDDAYECASRGVLHAFFLPRTRDEARGMVAKVASRAALVVSDEHPGFIHPAQNAAAAKSAGCAYVTVDDACGVPMALFPKEEYAARTLRPKLLRARDAWLAPLAEPTPRSSLSRARVSLPFEPVDLTRDDVDVAKLVGACAIDHGVPAVAALPGGSRAANSRLERFLRHKLAAYATDRNAPDRVATTGLSPYLHWGAISARRVALGVMEEARGRSSSAVASRSTSPRGERREATTPRATRRFLAGRERPWRRTRATRVRRSSRARISTPAARPTSSGTPRSSSSARRASSTTTRACSGASASSAGRRSRPPRTRSWCT
jgi:deoxyribodipyrimidine photo-lyase